MTCGHCDSSGSEKEKKEVKFKCEKCGSVSKDAAGECCGAPREKVCACGSGKYAKDCCER